MQVNQLPPNPFKRALREGRTQIGLWLGLADAYVAEVLATAGYDWLLIDAEHGPNDVRQVLGQLQAIAPYATHPAVRPVNDDPALIKQYLDVGAQTLLVPMVETAEQAARVVAATRYPPRGIRGLGTGLARAARWNQVTGYLHLADEELCVLVQVESVKALENLAAIAEGIATVRRAGKAAGILAVEPAMARRCLDLGTQFVAVGVDTTLLARSARDLLHAFKTTPAPTADAGRGSGY